jgi:hypothetical protein
MTNFKEHDGMLFKMLEEPTPLTPDAEMPCLVRLIQDDSPMGKHNKDLHGFDPERLTPKICTEVVDVNDLSDPNRGSARCDGFMSIQYYRYELIGTHVKEGSDDWALYHAINGEIVTMDDCGIYKIQDGKLWECFPNDSNEWRVVADDGYGYWLEYIHDNTGWQIYKEPEQPKTMPVNEFTDLLDAPIGWICKTRDGGSFPLKYIEVSPTRYAYEDKSGLTVYVMANGRYKKNGTDGRDIISCEHEQPKPESEYKVGDWVEVEETATGEIEHHTVERINTFCPVSPEYLVDDVWFNHDGMEIIPLDCMFNHRRITRKLSPSEVVVHIGCLSGTVSFADADRFILRGIGNSEMANACIMFKMLDAATCVLVESLLKAQDEDK